MFPAVITDVSDDSKLMQEEIFGPVTCIVPFKTEEEVRSLVCPPLIEPSSCRSEVLMCVPWRLGNVVVGKDGGEGKKRGGEGSMEEKGRRIDGWRRGGEGRERGGGEGGEGEWKRGEGKEENGKLEAF